MKMILKNRYFWYIVALFLAFIGWVYAQGNVAWLPSHANMPFTDTFINTIFLLSITALGAYKFGRTSGIISGLLAVPIVVWSYRHFLSDADVWVEIIFMAVIAVSVAFVISKFVNDTRKLQKALSEVKTLSGLIPICASCKKIRDDKGYWGAVESYISEHSDASFTHGICPDCMKRLYPEYYEQMKDEKKP
jgi:glucose-6-phosphate-specific signal transduction histidine kinase